MSCKVRSLFYFFSCSFMGPCLWRWGGECRQDLRTFVSSQDSFRRQCAPTRADTVRRGRRENIRGICGVAGGKGGKQVIGDFSKAKLRGQFAGPRFGSLARLRVNFNLAEPLTRSASVRRASICDERTRAV